MHRRRPCRQASSFAVDSGSINGCSAVGPSYRAMNKGAASGGAETADATVVFGFRFCFFFFFSGGGAADFCSLSRGFSKSSVLARSRLRCFPPTVRVMVRLGSSGRDLTTACGKEK